MKKSLCILVSILLLTGCSFTDDLPQKVHLSDNYIHTDNDASEVYQPNPQELARLFDNSIKKVLIKTTTPVTFEIPQWFSYNFTNPSEVTNAEFKLNIYQEVAKLEAEETEEFKDKHEIVNTTELTYIYSWYYIPKESIEDFKNNIFTYTGESDLNLNVSDLYTSHYITYDDIKIYGEPTPCTAVKQEVKCNVSKYTDLEDYTVPVAWYYFQLSNADYLGLRIKLDNLDSDHIYNINDNMDMLLVSENTIDKKVLSDDIEHAAELSTYLDREANYIASYVLVGDYIARYALPDVEKSTDKFEPEEVKNDSGNITYDNETDSFADATGDVPAEDTFIVKSAQDMLPKSKSDSTIKIDASMFQASPKKKPEVDQDEEGTEDDYNTDVHYDYFD